MSIKRKLKMTPKEKAMELFNEADEYTLQQMFLFLHSKEFIKGHIFAVLNLSDKKAIDGFVEFFKEPK